MSDARPRHALLALLLLLVQLASLNQLTRIPPEIAAQFSLILPLELALTLAWALIFAWLAVTLWRGAQTRRLGQALAIYAFVSVMRLLLFARADYDRDRLPFLLLTLLLAAFLLLRRRTRNRRESEHDCET